MSSALKHTPLYHAHCESGAKMVNFGGWEMPLSYGSQLDEHRAVRENVGVFDVSHMLTVDIGGSGSLAFLRRLLANDVARLTTPGKALYSCMLNPQGGVIDDLIVYFFGVDNWRLVVNAGTADKDLAWMRRVAQAESVDVDIKPRRDLAMVAVQGPAARETLWTARPIWKTATEPLSPFAGTFVDELTLVARTGYTGEDGYEIVLPAAQVDSLWNDLIQRGARPCGLGARDTLRLEAGMNLYGRDMDELTHPQEAALSWTVSYNDPQRQFIGRAALEQFATSRQLVAIKLLERGVMRPHMPVRTAQGQGEITSGTMSPTMGVSIGLARVPAGTQPGDAVQVEIRGKWLGAEIAKMPFVRHGQVLAA